MQASDTVAVAQDLFTGAGGTVRLIGSRCSGCDVCYFPKTVNCRNPACREANVAQTLLGPRGRLYSYTVQSYRPPASFAMDPWEPYAIGLIELPEGLRVMGMLAGCPLEDIRIDMAMELIVRSLYRDPQGRDVLTYMFKPADPADNRP